MRLQRWLGLSVEWSCLTISRDMGWCPDSSWRSHRLDWSKDHLHQSHLLFLSCEQSSSCDPLFSWVWRISSHDFHLCLVSSSAWLLLGNFEAFSLWSWSVAMTQKIFSRHSQRISLVSYSCWDSRRTYSLCQVRVLAHTMVSSAWSSSCDSCAHFRVWRQELTSCRVSSEQYTQSCWKTGESSSTSRWISDRARQLSSECMRWMTNADFHRC